MRKMLLLVLALILLLSQEGNAQRKTIKKKKITPASLNIKPAPIKITTSFIIGDDGGGPEDPPPPPCTTTLPPPVITEEKHCGYSTLTVTGQVGYLIWSTDEYEASINVSAGTYNVVQIVGSCQSEPATITAAPLGVATYYLDADNDGYSDGTTQTVCPQPTNYKLATELTATSGDCNDANASVWRSVTAYVDADGDGYTAGQQTICYGATLPTGFRLTSSGTDCEDGNSAIHPGATEICGNGIDDNCNGQQDEGSINTDGDSQADCVDTDDDNDGVLDVNDCSPLNAALYQSATLYADADGDTYTIGNGSVTCYGATVPTGFTLTKSSTVDCNDGDASAHTSVVWYKDADNDGHYLSTTSSCTSPGQGYTTTGGTLGDCDDADATKWRSVTAYLDADGDGYTAGQITICYGTTFTLPSGYRVTSSGTDCNDGSAAINPSTVWYKDADNDGYSDGTTLTQCAQPANYKLATDLTATSGDCNDGNGSIHAPVQYYVDADKDGYGSTTTEMVCALSAPSGYSTNNTDCDDANKDLSLATVWYMDADGDGYYTGSGVTSCTSPGTGYKYTGLTAGGDCLDNNVGVHPGAVEICGDNLDNNCNGQVDENCAVCGNATNFRTEFSYNNTAKKYNATFRWDAAIDPAVWQVEYKSTSQGAKWVPVSVAIVSARSASTGYVLALNQSYMWHIRAKCGKLWTAYSGSVSFKTPKTGSGTLTGISANAVMLEEVGKVGFSLYPNPSNGQFVVKLNTDDARNATAKIQLLDVTGRTLKIESAVLAHGVLQKTLYMPAIAAKGMYLVQILVQDKVYSTSLVYIK